MNVLEIERPVSTPNPGLCSALSEWEQFLPRDSVLTGNQIEPYRENCLSLERRIPAVLRPASESEVAGVVAIAARHRVPLYAISTGNNWGYGAAIPVTDGCVIVDLSQMNRVLEMDPELGLITVEPGVTQKILYDYLESRGLDFFVPTTGAGPLGSLVGNALERGFGMTPCVDHFQAVTSVRAVLPDGSIYRSAMAEAGATQCGLWKWGIGPYLDGLFSQGNAGIVTSLQLSLVRRPEHSEVYLFTLRDASRFPDLVDALHTVLLELRGPLSNLKLINRKQIEMTIGTNDIGVDLPPDFAWMGFGVIHGKRSMLPSIRKEIAQILKPHVSRLVFMNERRSAILKTLYRFIPGKRGALMRQQLGRIEDLLQLVNGVPRTLELKLAYRRVAPKSTASKDAPMNPIRDGVGIMWYAPVIPLKTQLVASMAAMAADTLSRYRFEPAVSMTTINENCGIGVIPIIYKRPDERDRAERCFPELLDNGIKLGCFPYRMNAGVMSRMTAAKDSVFWNLAATIKAAIDPNGILSPGRYSPHKNSDHHR